MSKMMKILAIAAVAVVLLAGFFVVGQVSDSDVAAAGCCCETCECGSSCSCPDNCAECDHCSGAGCCVK